MTTYRAYKEYRQADRLANGHSHRKVAVPFWDYTWIYLNRMRKLEYLRDKRGCIYKALTFFAKFKLRQISVKTGITIPPGTFGKGLTLHHYGSIIVNETVRGGEFVTIQSATNISGNVTIGNNVYIAPGAKILENVTIAEGVIIGANSVVTKSIMEPYTTWVGIPAKKIKDTGYVNRVKQFDRELA